MSLLVRVMQAWERCAGSHMPQALIHPGRTGMYRVLIYHLIHHSRMHASLHLPSKVYFLLDVRISPHLHFLPCTQRLLGSPPSSPRSRENSRWSFQLPAPHPIFISSLCSGPVCGRAWVSRLLPTSGHVAHGSVSSIDESRQPRVSSIARSRLGLPARPGSPSFTRPHLPQSL